MGNICQSLGKCCGDTKEAPTSTFQPAANRSCTDILFLLLYLASFGGMLAVILIATGRDSTPEKIYHGVDVFGNTCGQGVMSDRPYNAWITQPSVLELATKDCTDCFFIKTCLRNCTETGPEPHLAAPEMLDTYKSTDFGYFCIPDILPEGDVKVEFSGDFGDWQANAARAMGDLYTVWPIILGSAAVALLFAFLYNYLSESIAGVLVFFTLFIITAGGVLVSYSLIKAGYDARQSGIATNRSDAMYAVGIVLAVATLIFLLIIIAMRQRIRIAIEVVKEANRCVHDIWTLIVFPLFPMLLGLGYFVFWVVVAVYIAAVWDTEDRPLPGYITGHSRFNADLFPRNGTVSLYQYYEWDTSMQNAFAFVFVHLLWCVQFFIYFAYIVMAGTVANWYFAPRDANDKRIVGDNPGELSNSPVLDSCARTCRFHLGTVALAALIIAIVQAIRAAVKYIEKKAAAANGGKLGFLSKAVFCCIHCCLACLQCCLDKINKNALVWTAIWGDSFGTAACSSFKLLWSNLGRVGALSVISTFLLFLGKVTIAIATAGFGAIFIHFQYEEVTSPVLPVIVMFLIGYMVGSLFMAVFEVAMDAVFLCFLIDEKLHAASGTMCASKGLRKLVDSDEIQKANKEHAAEEHAVQERRLKQLGISDDHNTSGQTGVVMSATGPEKI